jgi:hypothetical protein
MKWRPIKTAPKDKLILLSCDEVPNGTPYVCVGRWIDVPHFNQIMSFMSNDGRLSENVKSIDDLYTIAKKDAHWADGYVGILRGGDGRECYEMRGGILFRPTHWMPLPKPPTKKKKS